MEDKDWSGEKREVDECWCVGGDSNVNDRLCRLTCVRGWSGLSRRSQCVSVDPKAAVPSACMEARPPDSVLCELIRGGCRATNAAVDRVAAAGCVTVHWHHRRGDATSSASGGRDTGSGAGSADGVRRAESTLQCTQPADCTPITARMHCTALRCTALHTAHQLNTARLRRKILETMEQRETKSRAEIAPLRKESRSLLSSRTRCAEMK